MGSHTYCSKCNSSCQDCNTCESCNDKCNASGGCLSIQTFCKKNQVYNNKFSFQQCVSKNEIICKTDQKDHFSRTTWNKIIEHINEAFDKGVSPLSDHSDDGNGVQSGSTGGSSGVLEDNTNLFITAEQFKKAATALDSLGGFSSTSGIEDTITALKGIKKDTVIYGHYFESLESYAKNLKLKNTQCDDCNAGCNVQCNLCQLCNVSSNCQVTCELNRQTSTKCCGCNTGCEVTTQTTPSS